MVRDGAGQDVVRDRSPVRRVIEPTPAAAGVSSLWDLTLPLWDVEDRPEHMRIKETVNTLSLANFLAFKEHFEQKIKKEGKGDSVFGKDRKIASKCFKEEEDNCCEKLHAVRFERGPVVELEKYWAKMPVKRMDTYRHLPLEFTGAGSSVNENTITRAHDRTIPLRLKMFSKNNFSKKGFGSSNNSDNKEAAESWEAPKAIMEVHRALSNMTEVYACIWPLDPTPRVLNRVLLHYDFGASYGSDEKNRCKLIEQFCDLVLSENARRAVREDPPLSWEKAKDRWRDCAERWKDASYDRQSNYQSYNNRNNRFQGNQHNNNNSYGGASNSFNDGASKAAANNSAKAAPAPRLNGVLLCFMYNSGNNGKGCTRIDRIQGGCRDVRGSYLHACNFDKGGGKICYGKHERYKSH